MEVTTKSDLNTAPADSKPNNCNNENPEVDTGEAVVPSTAPKPVVDSSKKAKKDDNKPVKKDDKTMELFWKAVNTEQTVDDRVTLVSKKYVQVAEDNKKLQFYIKQSDKRQAMLVKEKEHLQQEYNKSVLVKSTLENLCRELQKQNKAIKEESLLKIREEEERRKETQNKFQNTLTEITALLQQNNEKNVKLRDDNISMSEKFKNVVQQYQCREQQVEKMAKQMALESQLSDAKIHKAYLEHKADKEKLLAEMEQLRILSAQYKAKIVEMQGTEVALKGQLAVYTDKYDEFQNALVKSNQVFGGFKEQMDLMSKKIKRLEKESLSWRKRWETSQTALLDMCGERQVHEEKAAATARQLLHMQSLCRTLQAERTALLGVLKEHKIERPPVPAPTPAPPPPPPVAAPPKDNAKMDAMVANCAQLRQSLAHLQSQLNVLTTSKNGAIEETSKSEKQKKSKSKKTKIEKSQKNDSEKVNVTQDLEVPAKHNQNVNGADKGKETTDEETGAQKKIDEEDEIGGDKIDDSGLETLIQAMNIANMNLSDLEAAHSGVAGKIDVVDELSLDEDEKYTEEQPIQNLNTEAKQLTETKSNPPEDTVSDQQRDDEDLSKRLEHVALASKVN